MEKKVETLINNRPKFICGEYCILNAEQLIWFAKRVNNGDIKINGKLFKDIDISEKSDFIGIGTSQNPYKGIFDGNDYNINVNLNVSDRNPALFGVVAGNAIIKNLGVTGTINTRMKFISGIISKIQGNSTVTIKKCRSEVNLVYLDE